jgi:hypothetical protein
VSLLADLRLAYRTLLKNPGFTAIAVIMLALGIGINAAVFTVTDAVLFKGFHFVKRNDRLVYISDGGCCISYPDFETYRAEAKSFQGMAIVHGVARILTDQSGFAERYDAKGRFSAGISRPRIKLPARLPSPSSATISGKAASARTPRSSAAPFA